MWPTKNDRHLVARGSRTRAVGVGLVLLLLGGCTVATDDAAQTERVPSDPSQPQLVGQTRPNVLTSDDLYTIYQGVLTSGVQPVDGPQMVAGALKGAHAAATEQGLLPVEAAVLDTTWLQASRDPRTTWAAFGSAYDGFVQKLGSRMDVSAIGRGAARGMLSAVGDPLTGYLERSAVEARRSARDAAIGVTLTPGSDGEAPIVRDVEPEGPADRVGIRAGDVIRAVGDRQSRGLHLYDVLSSLSGAQGSQVTVTFESPGGRVPRAVTLQRARVRPAAVSSKLVDGVLLLQLRSFDTGSAAAVRRALLDSASAGAVGWVVDVRGNGAGSLTEAASVASLFAGDKVLAIEEEQGAQLPVRGTGPALSVQRPLVLLIDGATAGPGELLAGAIRDHELGRVIGTPSAGRLGTPRLVALSDGSAAEIAIGRMLSPAGRSLLGAGVAPDQTVTVDAQELARGVDRVQEQGLALAPR